MIFCYFQSFSLVQKYLVSEEGECVMYLTSLGIVRSTQERCNMVRKILRNMCVRWAIQSKYLIFSLKVDLKDSFSKYILFHHFHHFAGMMKEMCPYLESNFWTSEKGLEYQSQHKCIFLRYSSMANCLG